MNAENNAVAGQILPNFDQTVDVKEYKFNFRKDDLGNKRPTVELKLPIPSVEGIVKILEAGGKQLELLIAAVEGIVLQQARALLNDNEGMTAATFPTDQCVWDFIANIPETDKRGSGISKEVWEAFSKDYVAVMPGATGKSAQQVALAAKLLASKFNPVKTQKDVITILRDQLAIYANTSTNAESFQDCIKFLSEKAEMLLASDNTIVAGAL